MRDFKTFLVASSALAIATLTPLATAPAFDVGVVAAPDDYVGTVFESAGMPRKPVVDSATALFEATADRWIESRTRLLIDRYPSVSVRRDAPGYVISVLDRRDGRGLYTRETRDILTAVADILQDYPGRKVLVEGHTDSTGCAPDNYVAARRRAFEAVFALASNGVDSARMVPVSYGESYPVKPNHTRSGRSVNQRLDIVVVDAGAQSASLMRWNRSDAAPGDFAYGSPAETAIRVADVLRLNILPQLAAGETETIDEYLAVLAGEEYIAPDRTD